MARPRADRDNSVCGAHRGKSSRWKVWMHVDSVRDESEWRAEKPLRKLSGRPEVDVSADNVLRMLSSYCCDARCREPGSSKMVFRGSPQPEAGPCPCLVILGEQSQIIPALLQPYRELSAERRNSSAESRERRGPEMEFQEAWAAGRGAGRGADRGASPVTRRVTGFGQRPQSHFHP